MVLVGTLVSAKRAAMCRFADRGVRGADTVVQFFPHPASGVMTPRDQQFRGEKDGESRKACQLTGAARWLEFMMRFAGEDRLLRLPQVVFERKR
jgi:hypothetical protein